MGKGAYTLLVALTCVVLLPRCLSQGSPTVVIDGYARSSIITSGTSVSLGTQIILVCRVAGLPYGTPLSYTWTCPNGPCEVEGYYGIKIYNEHILAVNTTSTSDGGTYTCQVTTTGGQEATGNFTLRVTGGPVVHSYGRLIPHEFPITDLQQISGPDGIGRITCTVSSGTARFGANGGKVEGGGVTEIRNGATATLVVSPSDVGSFQNKDLYCSNINANFFYLFISSANPLSVPSFIIDGVTNSVVEYQVKRNDNITNPLITGYEVIRFGVPMIGEHWNSGRGRRGTISPAVPGAQYRITAWALLGDSNGRRSARPAEEYVITGEARPSAPRMLSVEGILEARIELNWLPSTEPNGEVHYVIYYTSEGGSELSIDTGSNLTHYNLTGLERNRVHTNIAVQAVNSAGSSDRSATIAPPIPTPPREVSITRIFQDVIELNWLPPTEPNGEVHYVIYYTPEGGTEQAIDTLSDLTHYNLTELERSRVYTNIAVQAVHLAGKSERNAVVAPPIPTPPRDVNITRVFQDGLELNWLPPTEPNGEVHYVIYYTPEGGTEQSIDTGSNLTRYILIGLERNRVHTNIAVEAVHLAGRSNRSAITDVLIIIFDQAEASKPLLPAVISLGVVVLLLITCVALLVLALAVTATKRNKVREEKGPNDPLNYYSQTGGGEGKTKERIYAEAGKVTVSVKGQKGHYQELNMETMDKRQYASLHGEGHQC